MPHEPTAPAALCSKEKRAAAVRINGKLGGRPPGPQSGSSRVRLTNEEREELLEEIATEWLTHGGPIGWRKDNKLTDVTQNDVIAIQRFVGMSADEINRRISGRLANLSDEILDHMFEQLRSGQYEPKDLNLGFAISEDKRARLDGRAMLASSNNVGTQINIFSEGKTREQIIAELHRAKTAAPLNVTPDAAKTEFPSAALVIAPSPPSKPTRQIAVMLNEGDDDGFVTHIDHNTGIIS